MADVFEKVELRDCSFCLHFSPCLRSQPSAKPELTAWLAADVKRDGRLCMIMNYILRKN